MKFVARFAGAALICALVQGGAVAATAAQAGHIVNTPAKLKISHDAVKSTNWSGYAAEGTAKFTDVVGTWVQPAVKCKGTSTRYSSFWVGIDGYSTDSVEQLGTDSDCDGTTPSYYGWWEMYPANSVNLPTSKYPVQAGDTLTAEVSVSGSTYTLSMHSSEGWTFTKAVTGSASLKQASAEWIAESPEICSATCKLAKLANFGTVGFTNCEAATGGADEPISSFTTNSGPHEITMVTKKGVKRAVPSALNGTGNGFSIAWAHD
jgi:hypothetical protein